MKTHRQKILFLHPEANAYRKEFFNLLNNNLDITFAFTGGHNWVRRIPEARNWKYKNFRPYKFIGYRGEFTPGIFFELIRDYDIIVSSIITSFPTHLSFLIAKLLKKRFILFDELWMWPGSFFANLAFPYARYIAKHSDAILVSGTKAREFFIQRLGVSEDKIFICPNSAENYSLIKIDPVKLKHIQQSINPDNRITILYLSRVIELRNLDGLIFAFDRLQKNYHNITLVVGGDGDYLHFCKRLIKDLDIQNICFLGKVNHQDVVYYYHLCDIFVLPGKFMPSKSVNVESWGLVLNEVMSLGKPVVSTDSVGAAFDLIQNGNNGFRVKNNNVDELSLAIEKLIIANEIRMRMGRTSLEVIKNFTAQRQSELFIHALNAASESA